ncbi:hypothetical protein [Saccharopolyspora griseoalba]|uniref:ABC transporter permease n=1 Tax=Saccharopolyspora griseoalba TaxID=1431848 RepID=A0ABW2LKI8_9PSEU
MTSLMRPLADRAPADGAGPEQVLVAWGGAVLLAVGLVALGRAHRTGRITWLARVSERAEHSRLLRGLPGWSALPMALALPSVVVALIGLYWSIALRITTGARSPHADLAHLPLLLGLFGLFTAGVLAIVLPRGERPGRASVRITADWHAPASGLVLVIAGGYALLGFALDGVWHRIYGEDVTLWGPTTLMLIGGTGLSLVAVSLLEREGRFVRTGRAETMRANYVRRGMLSGALLLGLSVFQTEFDFGVPQFRMVFHPLLIALAAGCALVTARMWVGRGGALFAVGCYLVVRGGILLLLGPAFDELSSGIPLYLVEALCVEIAAVALARRPLLLGIAAGLLIGTIGFTCEYLWTQLAFRLPWEPDMLVEGVAMSLAGGVAGGLLGALLVQALRGELSGAVVRNGTFAGALAVVVLAVANGVIGSAPSGVTANVALDPETHQAEIRISPPDLAQNPTWLTVTGWAGGGLHVDRLQEVAPGVYRTHTPVPLDAHWKTMVRLHHGRSIVAVPIDLPRAAPLDVSARPTFSRQATSEFDLLQREAAPGVPGWLWHAATAVVLVCSLALVVLLGWAAQRIGRAISGPPCTEKLPFAPRASAES